MPNLQTELYHRCVCISRTIARIHGLVLPVLSGMYRASGDIEGNTLFPNLEDQQNKDYLLYLFHRVQWSPNQQQIKMPQLLFLEMMELNKVEFIREITPFLPYRYDLPRVHTVPRSFICHLDNLPNSHWGKRKYSYRIFVERRDLEREVVCLHPPRY